MYGDWTIVVEKFHDRKISWAIKYLYLAINDQASATKVNQFKCYKSPIITQRYII